MMMLGGGFLKQAAESAAHNRNLLRKAKERGPFGEGKVRISDSGKLESWTMDEVEQTKLLMAVTQSNYRDRRGQIIALTLSVPVTLILLWLILEKILRIHLF
jgi:hypothetical protein